MDVHQKDKNINSRQQRQPQQQSKSNATYHFDDDASQISQQSQQPQQVPVTPPSPKAQPRKNSRASRRSRTARSSDLRIVDPNTNRDVLTGEEVPPSAVVTPPTSPEIVTTGVVSTQVEAADQVEAPLTVAAPFFSETEETAPSPTGNTDVAFIEKVEAEKKTVPTVVAASPSMASYKEIGNAGIKYSRENLLGQGTYGSVYLGIYNDQQVAVKRIELKQSEKEEREVDLQQNLDHENVLKILKVEKDDDFRYIVLELCAGTLGEVIDKTYKGPAYPSDPIVLYQIADGLNYIHSKKLIHRDIKPENILISMNGQQLKLSDFGLSKQISIRDTCSMSGTKGTLLWMAPELHGNNKKATPKCDVFPCGCVFFVFLTRENDGIHPFGDMKDPLRLQRNIRSGKPINIEKLKADHYAVPVIRGMIKKNPRQRIYLANVKERLRPFCNPSLGNSTSWELAKSTSLNYKDDPSSLVNPQEKKTFDRKKNPQNQPSLNVVRDKRRVSVSDLTSPFVETIPEKGLSKRNSQQGNREGMDQQLSLAKQRITKNNNLTIISIPPYYNVYPPSQHKELDFISKVDSKLKTKTPASSQVNIGFQYSLEKYLRDANHLTTDEQTDEVCSWIQKKYVGEVNPAFIRALVTAVIESSIEGRGTDSKLNNTVLKHWTEVLRRYVDNIPDRELQLLYAVQTLVTQRQHPKGLIQGIFETLYDSNVVSEEGFESWVSVDDPLEREGKDVALKMITSFLTWLKEADPESDQEADA